MRFCSVREIIFRFMPILILLNCDPFLHKREGFILEMFDTNYTLVSTFLKVS